MKPRTRSVSGSTKDAHEAARFYAATFPDSEVTAVHKAPGDYPGGKEGDVLTVEFSRPGRSLFWSQRRSGVQAQRSLFVPDRDGQSGRDPEAAGLTRLTIRQPLEAERGLSASFDLSRTDGPLSYTATLFTSRIAAPIHVERSPSYVLRSLPDPTTNLGIELLGTLRREPFSVTTTYTYVRARETVNAIEEDVPLTPRHSAGVVGMWEKEDVGRVGIEWYYTGRQSLDENPYRTVSEPYMIFGLLAERQFGHVRLFINGENLTGVRQTRWDPLLRSTRAADGRWTVDAWAPLEGRNINGGLRIRF